MSDFTSVTMDAQLAAEANVGGAIIADSRLISGRPKFLQAEWLVPAGTGAADTIDLCYLSGGATLVPGATVTVDDAAGASTIDLALEDGTVIAAGISVSAAGTSLIPLAVGSVINPTKQKIIATISGAVTADKTIWFNFPNVSGE